MNIGSLYQVKKYFWVLFPTKEIVASADAGVLSISKLCRLGFNANNENAAHYTARYSRMYNCNVTWFSPESFVVCLEEDGNFKKVLTSEGLIGWTWVDDNWFEEVKS